MLYLPAMATEPGTRSLLHHVKDSLDLLPTGVA